ncbi:MAG: ferredoxin [Casimicrobiaceae bacterium]
MRVIVDRGRCVSSGNCADLAPLVFTQDDDSGVVVLLQEHPDESLREVVRRAAMLCPSQAIRVEE